jgi:hypothetical protein
LRLQSKKTKLNLYRDQGKIKHCTPKVRGNNALIFGTYSGPYAGIYKSLPAGKTMTQHFGFTILGRLYAQSEVH